MSTNMIAFIGILRKEIRLTLLTPIAYVVFFLFTLLSSSLFWVGLRKYELLLSKSKHIEDMEMLARLNFNDVILADMFVNIQSIFVFLIPILTMRVFAEEKSMGTMELFRSAPIRSETVVLAKYVHLMLMVIAFCLILTLYPFILTFYGENSLLNTSVLDWNTVGLGIFGVFCCGALFSSLGMLFSAISDRQIISALMTFFVLLLLWFVGGASAGINGLVGDFLTFISPLSHLSSFLKGILDMQDVFYYFSLTLLFIFMSYRAVESHKWV